MIFEYIELERLQKLYTIEKSYDDEGNATPRVTDKIWEMMQQRSFPWLFVDREDRLTRLGKLWAAKHGHKEKYNKK